jgi:hypothetical protein
VGYSHGVVLIFAITLGFLCEWGAFGGRDEAFGMSRCGIRSGWR